jgi:hypothetical protein
LTAELEEGAAVVKNFASDVARCAGAFGEVRQRKTVGVAQVLAALRLRTTGPCDWFPWDLEAAARGLQESRLRRTRCNPRCEAPHRKQSQDLVEISGAAFWRWIGVESRWTPHARQLLHMAAEVAVLQSLRGESAPFALRAPDLEVPSIMDEWSLVLADVYREAPTALQALLSAVELLRVLPPGRVTDRMVRSLLGVEVSEGAESRHELLLRRLLSGVLPRHSFTSKALEVLETWATAPRPAPAALPGP